MYNSQNGYTILTLIKIKVKFIEVLFVTYWGRTPGGATDLERVRRSVLVQIISRSPVSMV